MQVDHRWRGGGAGGVGGVGLLDAPRSDFSRGSFA